jgi:hypothetical protein
MIGSRNSKKNFFEKKEIVKIKNISLGENFLPCSNVKFILQIKHHFVNKYQYPLTITALRGLQKRDDI